MRRYYQELVEERLKDIFDDQDRQTVLTWLISNDGRRPVVVALGMEGGDDAPDNLRCPPVLLAERHQRLAGPPLGVDDLVADGYLRAPAARHRPPVNEPFARACNPRIDAGG